MRTFLPGAIQAKQRRQQQANQVEDHRGIVTDPAVVAVEVGLGVEQEIGDVHRDHQEQLTLAAIHRAVGAAQ